MVGDTIYGLQCSMGRPSKSPARAFYCVSLALPREAELRILRIGRFLEGRGMRADPVPPGLVLMRCAECPSPPVTGLLPRCESAPRFHGRLEIVEPALDAPGPPPEAALPAEGRPGAGCPGRPGISRHRPEAALLGEGRPAPPPNHSRSPNRSPPPADASNPPGNPDHPPAIRPWAVLPVDLGPWYSKLRGALLARGPSPPPLPRMSEFPPPGPFIPLACFQGGLRGPGELGRSSESGQSSKSDGSSRSGHSSESDGSSQSSQSSESGQSSKSGESADLFAHEELQSILDETERGGWRAMNLVCRRIDTVAGRPWYMAAYWRTEWKRRLRRAPEANRR